MIQDMIEQMSDEFLIEAISSPIAAQLLNFCDEDDGGAGGAADLFASSNQSLLIPPFEDTTSSSATTAAIDANSPLCCYGVDVTPFSPFSSALYTLLDGPPPPPDPEPDHAIYPSSSSSSSNPLPLASPPATFPLPQMPATETFVGDLFDHIVFPEAFSGGYSLDPAMVVALPPAGVGDLLSQNQQQQAAYEEQCYAASAAMQQPTNLVGLEAPPCGFLDGVGMSAALYDGGEEPEGLFSVGMPAVGQATGLMGLGDVADSGGLGPFAQESMPSRTYSPSDLVVGSGSQHPVVGGSSNAPPLPTTADISTVDDSSYKVGRLSAEERKEKINRYMRKRNERNFSKKIKYACRKTLADSRPRVRGRFAKNDELGEEARRSSNNDFDDEEDMVIKEEHILDSTDILGHLNGVNSFKFNYTVESWI